MKFGALLPMGRTATPAAMVARAEEAEAVGFESVWVIEDYDSWEAFATLGFVAARTRRIKLGISVTVPYVRNVAMLAAAGATLDRFSEGRLILGLGRSLPVMLAQAGIEQRAPLAVLRETTLALRELWSGECTSFKRQQVSLHEVEMELTPHQECVPIVFGTQAPKGLALAGSVADGVVFSAFAGPALVKRAVETLREAAVAAGRDPHALTVSRLTHIALTDDPVPYLDTLRPFVLRDLCTPGRGEEMLAGTPWTTEILQPIRQALRVDELLKQGREPYRWVLRVGDVPAALRHLPLDLVRELSIVGPAAHCREHLAEYSDAGVDRFIVSSQRPLAELQDVFSTGR